METAAIIAAVAALLSAASTILTAIEGRAARRAIAKVEHTLQNGICKGGPAEAPKDQKPGA